MWVAPVLWRPAITNWAVYWRSDNETESLTSNNVVHLLQGSLQHMAGIWRHGNKLSYKAALVDPHSLVQRRVLAGGVTETERSSTERLLPFLVALLDPFTAKLQQLSWHLSDFQVNNLLSVAFGFKLPSHFVARAIPIVSAVIHRPYLE